MKNFIYTFGVLSILLIPLHASAAAYPDGCTATTAFSATTGHSCSAQPCQQGDLFNNQTGQPCSTTNSPSSVLGCNNTAGFSSTTGAKCDGSVPVSSLPATSLQTTIVPDNSFEILQLQNEYTMLKNQSSAYANYGTPVDLAAPGLAGSAAGESNLSNIQFEMQNIQSEIQALGGNV